jgi:hypothetical protein
MPVKSANGNLVSLSLNDKTTEICERNVTSLISLHAFSMEQHGFSEGNAEKGMAIYDAL